MKTARQVNWRAVFRGAGRSAARGLPGAGAIIAGDDSAPGTGAGVAGKTAATRSMRGADRDLDRDAAGAVDRARDPAATGGGDAAAGNREGNTVAGAAGAARGGEHD